MRERYSGGKAAIVGESDGRIPEQGPVNEPRLLRRDGWMGGLKVDDLGEPATVPGDEAVFVPVRMDGVDRESSAENHALRSGQFNPTTARTLRRKGVELRKPLNKVWVTPAVALVKRVLLPHEPSEPNASDGDALCGCALFATSASAKWRPLSDEGDTILWVNWIFPASTHPVSVRIGWFVVQVIVPLSVAIVIVGRSPFGIHRSTRLCSHTPHDSLYDKARILPEERIGSSIRILPEQVVICVSPAKHSSTMTQSK